MTVGTHAAPSGRGSRLIQAPAAVLAGISKMTTAIAKKVKHGDHAAQFVAMFATTLSVVAYVVTDKAGDVLAYNDSISHLEIARRVVDSVTPSAAQLGGVWLPLPHVLMLPLVWDNTLYQDGFAGSISSMIAYVICVVLVYKIGFRLTGKKFAGVVGALVFAVNINMLYMQSTPMTESLLFCLLAAMIYCVQQWVDTGKAALLLKAGAPERQRPRRWLMAGGVATLFATLTRYESWVIGVCLLLVVIFIAWQQRPSGLTRKRRVLRTVDAMWVFLGSAGAGVLAWFIWNLIIFHDPLNFQNGDYAKPALWLTNSEPAIGHWKIAIETYWYAMTDNMSLWLMLPAAAGLVLMVLELLRRKSKALYLLPALTPMAIVPFFMVAFYTGQRPLHIMQINHSLYNVRFGLIMLLPAAIFIAYLVGKLQHKPRWMAACGIFVVALALVVSATSLQNGNVITLRDPQLSAHTEQAEQDATVAAFAKMYRSGLVMEESFGNERIADHIPSNEEIYEGSNQLWLPDLANPAGHNIAWIITRVGGSSGTDKVFKSLTPAKLKYYTLMYASPGGYYKIYALTVDLGRR